VGVEPEARGRSAQWVVRHDTGPGRPAVEDVVAEGERFVSFDEPEARSGGVGAE